MNKRVLSVFVATIMTLLVPASSPSHAMKHAPGDLEPLIKPETLTVMAWNIWRGGREDGDEVGPARVVDVMRDSKADIVAMQETYGSGELIADALGFHFAPRGTNVSILSRYPIVEDISVHEEFQCVGAIIALPDGSRLAFYSVWLPYSAEIWAEGTRDITKPQSMLAACEASQESLTAMHAAIEMRLADEKYAGVPVVIAGDFNSMSHLDYGEVGFDQYEVVVDWPTSHVLHREGFVDTYRACNPDVDRSRDSTWTPRFPEQEQDRIDFIFARSRTWAPTGSKVVRTHAEGFPSDHAAVVTQFVRREDGTNATGELPLRAASYNIKHSYGMDGTINLARTADVLRGLDADFIGLQEVDLGVARSNGDNQANVLAGSLSMHPAFGSFMDFGGGQYGMAILSRHPIVNVTSLPLPNGNEPRIALVVEARLPDGSTVLVVNVHFDWVADDAFRFQQASTLAEFLRTVSTPFILLGDFNDQPGSRTMKVFEDIATEAAKPAGDRLTFPSDTPTKEIDFIWYSPEASWRLKSTEVVHEAVASDHRPVVADLLLQLTDEPAQSTTTRSPARPQ